MLDKIIQFFKKDNSEKEDNNTESETVPFEQRMRHLENYFKNHSLTDITFKPEFEAATEINKIVLKDDENISEKDLKKVIQIFNDTNTKHHYNGSGWFDLRLHIQLLIRKSNYKYKTLPNNNIELISQD